MSAVRGLERARRISVERDRRARELKAAGGRVLAYMCCFVPPELIRAAGMLPYRIMGQPADDVVEANRYLESFGCPWVRNCFEQSLKGRLDFSDGVVIAHSCDMVQRVYGPWTQRQQLAYSHLLNAPHGVSDRALDFFERELGFFKESLERHTGKEITDAALASEIALANEGKRLVKELYQLRNRRSALTGVEMFHVLVAGLSIPAAEYVELLREVLEEVRPRSPRLPGAPRLLVWGSVVDHPKLYEIIEETGGHVVADDNCIGTRSCVNEVDPGASPLKALSRAYFADVQCPRTDRGPGTARFDYLLDMVRDYDVRGVVGYTYQFCDPHKLDYPDLRDLLKAKGVPMLLVDDDYSLGNGETIKNRVQAFLETLS